MSKKLLRTKLQQTLPKLAAKELQPPALDSIGSPPPPPPPRQQQQQQLQPQQQPQKRSCEAVKVYLTRPLERCHLVASEDSEQRDSLEKQGHSQLNSVHADQQLTNLHPFCCSLRFRKSPLPVRRLEVPDFDGEPLPTLGRLCLTSGDQDENRMRWQHLCLICRKRLQSSSQLYAHMEAHSVQLHRASKHILGTRIRCCLCLELLQTWKRFRTHMQRHTGHQPYRCRQCAETFSTNGNLKRHLNRKH